MTEQKSQNKQLAPIDEIRSTMQKMAPQFQMVLPSHVTADRFVRVVLTAIQTTPMLLDCDRGSLYAAAMKSATDGLICDGREAALIPFRVKGQLRASYMPMVAGILKKVRNSGELESIHPEVVYTADEFSWWIDENGPHLKHTPNLEAEERGEPRLVYTIARVKSGGVYIEIMSKKEVELVRDVSKAKDTGPWSGDFKLEMWKKTCIRRLSKRLPVSTDLDDVIRRDDELTDLSQMVHQPVQAEKAKSSRLSQLLAGDEPPALPVGKEERVVPELPKEERFPFEDPKV